MVQTDGTNNLQTHTRPLREAQYTNTILPHGLTIGCSCETQLTVTLLDLMQYRDKKKSKLTWPS